MAYELEKVAGGFDDSIESPLDCTESTVLAMLADEAGDVLVGREETGTLEEKTDVSGARVG